MHIVQDKIENRLSRIMKIFNYNDKREWTDANTKMTQMLKLSDSNFNTTIMKCYDE